MIHAESSPGQTTNEIVILLPFEIALPYNCHPYLQEYSPVVSVTATMMRATLCQKGWSRTLAQLA